MLKNQISFARVYLGQIIPNISNKVYYEIYGQPHRSIRMSMIRVKIRIENV